MWACLAMGFLGLGQMLHGVENIHFVAVLAIVNFTTAGWISTTREV